jgi:hypothetical protein
MFCGSVLSKKNEYFRTFQTVPGTFLECFELKFWSHKWSTKTGVQDYSLKMARNALEETNNGKFSRVQNTKDQLLYQVKVRGGKLEDVWIRDKDVYEHFTNSL